MEEKSNSSHPSEKSMEHNGNVMEEFKSPDPINSSKKSMEDQVIAMEESKFSDPIKPREKTMEDQVIDMEESKFSDPINLRYMMKERHKTFKQIVVTAMILSLLLTIFGAMNNFSSLYWEIDSKI
ncbi:hypothetical protein P8452_58028 [Trifolium repens]|nr:hypothetical protein P8452_58028 [Trifolium repens]